MLNKDGGHWASFTKPGGGTGDREGPQNFSRAVYAGMIETRTQWRRFTGNLIAQYGERRGAAIVCVLTHDDVSDCAKVGSEPEQAIVPSVDGSLPKAWLRYEVPGLFPAVTFQEVPESRGVEISGREIYLDGIGIDPDGVREVRVTALSQTSCSYGGQVTEFSKPIASNVASLDKKVGEYAPTRLATRLVVSLVSVGGCPNSSYVRVRTRIVVTVSASNYQPRVHVGDGTTDLAGVPFILSQEHPAVAASRQPEHDSTGDLRWPWPATR